MPIDETVDTLETLHGNASTAFDAYKAEPNDDNEANYREAMTKVGEYKAPEPVKPQAPEKYELALEEDSKLSPDRLDEIALTAKEQGLTNEAAQERVVTEEGAVGSYLESKETEAAETHKAWEKEISDDKELGGEHLKETKELVVRTVEKFGNEGLIEMMKLSGLDKHPDWIRFTSNIGKSMADDKFFHNKSSQNSGEKSTEEIFYGKVDQPAQ